MFVSYRKILSDLDEASHLRSIKSFERKAGKYIYIDNKKLINLSSNNYLGFADNEEITEEFLNFAGKKYSFGSASARLLTGTLPVYNGLEKLIGGLFKKEAALIFNSGYHANVGINSTLAGAGDVIFSDKLNHASIIDGMLLAKGKFFRYKHNDMHNLEKLLIRERNNFNNAVIVSESVFSMDGDIADLKKLVELKKKYNCILVLDEAHAFGVFGKNGLGVCEDLGITSDVDLIVGTFGKAIGSMGAFAAGSRILIEYLVNKARPFIFSTSLPPINIAFSKWIIENKLPYTYDARMRMINLGKNLGSESHIIPVIVGENSETVQLSEILYQNGYFTLPIRPPTVPDGTSRLRLSLTADMQMQDLETLVKLLKDFNIKVPC